MNERIKLLAEQAHEFAVSIYEKRLETEKSSNVFFYKIKDKQFAELIVQECIDVHKDDYGVDIIGNVLKKHFGVEE